MRDLYYRSSLHKTSERDLYTRSPDIPGPPRSLHMSSLQDLFTRPLWEISIQDLLLSLDLLARPLSEVSTGALYKISLQTSMRNPPDIPGPPFYKISSQDPHRGHLYTRSPGIPGSPRSRHRSSLQDLFTDLFERSLYKSSLQDLFTNPVWDISIQDLLISLDLLGLLTGALYKISSQDLYIPPRSLRRSSLQDFLTRPLWAISLQELSTRSLRRTPMRDP